VLGLQYNYWSINAFLTVAIVASASHMPLDEFARVNLFDPLGIRDYSLAARLINRITGQGNLSITRATWQQSAS
jgi:CubicO group peptidase (beta-lactamase class C family)